MVSELERVRRALLDDLRVDLGPEQGREAFERHQLLAIRFYRAARLNAPGEGERAGWCRYFDEHFLRGGEHGRLLYERWRCALVKDEMPGRGVAITHGHPDAHWQQTELGLCVNLESMWDDFEVSVTRFTEALTRDPEHLARTLERLDKTLWTVQPITIRVPQPTIVTSRRPIIITPAVTASSATAMAPPRRTDE